jgi:hypothetical protein
LTTKVFVAITQSYAPTAENLLKMKPFGSRKKERDAEWNQFGPGKPGYGAQCPSLRTIRPGAGRSKGNT